MEIWKNKTVKGPLRCFQMPLQWNFCGINSTRILVTYLWVNVLLNSVSTAYKSDKITNKKLSWKTNKQNQRVDFCEFCFSESCTKAKEAHTAGPYPSFCSMKQLRVLLLPPGWDACPSPTVWCRYPFIHLEGWKQCGVKIRHKGVDPPTFRSEVERADHYTTAPQQQKPSSQEKNYNKKSPRGIRPRRCSPPPRGCKICYGHSR